MSIPSIAQAYAQHGPDGLTEKGKKARIACIISATMGTAFVITGIILFTILMLSFQQNYSGLFPDDAVSRLGGCFGTAISLSGGAGLIVASVTGLHGGFNFPVEEFIEANPPIKHAEPKYPDPRGNEL